MATWYAVDGRAVAPHTGSGRGMTFDEFLTWMAVGLVVGTVARLAAKDGGHGLIVDMTLGFVGGLLGGMLFQVAGGSQEAGWFVMAAMMCVGAAALIVAQRAVWPRRV
jgi:uncharacterized membrane protein YeaQ/YmgE (transglycosylase-associated protein family)